MDFAFHHSMFRLILLLYLLFPTIAQAQSVFLEDLTWPEVRDALASGTKTIIIPTGGTEQNGPHMALGKHNVIVRYTAEAIARQLGHTLVAPVIAYVPEGAIEPAEGHMRFPGTISLSEKTFAALLEETARSFKAHGFTLICFLGDSGGNQAAQAKVAEKLSEEWQSQGVRVLQANDYYEHNGQDEWMATQGETPPALGSHAAIEDTSELMAIDAGMVRTDQLADHSRADNSGANGNATHASTAYGKRLLQLKIDAAVRQIRAVRN